MVGSIPGLALPLLPLTLAAGPEIAYNVAALAMPVLAAWSAFLLCRHLTRAFWPSLAGGYLFGFSSYMLGQLLGHLALIAVFPLPLTALAVLRHLEGTMSRRRFAVSLGLLLAFELAVSTEVTFTMTLALALSLALGWGFFPERRSGIRALLAPVALGYLLAGVLVSPILWYALTDFRPDALNSVESFPGDAANLVVPTGILELSGSRANAIAAKFLGNTAEQDLYLGVPTLVIAAWFLASRRHTQGARFLGSALAIAVVASLGSGLYLEGRRLSAAPWALVHRLPAFDNVISARLAVYTTLLATVIVALWAASSPAATWVRATLVGAAVLALVPGVVSRTPWKLRPHVPGFFATGGASTRCLRTADDVLVLPYLSDALLWQTNRGYRFRLAAPYVASSAPPRFANDPVIQAVIHTTAVPGGGAALLRRARKLGVDAIVVEASRPGPWPTVLDRVARPKVVQGVLLYRLSGTTPAGCRAA